MTWSRAARVAAVAAVTAAVAVGAGTLVGATGEESQQAAGSWRELPTPPVSPRMGSIAAWTGTEALFLGGTVGGLCPPNASCTFPEETARDGVAYDPVAGTWRSTAPAPVDLPSHGHRAVVGDVVHLLDGDDLLAYDASEDAWTRLPGPPGPADGFWSLTEVDDRVVALRGQQRDEYYADQVYDPGTGTWSALPRDPLVPSFARQAVETPYGMVLSAQPEVDQPGSQLETSLTRIALLDGSSWRELPVTDQLGRGFTWTGRRLVAPDLGGADGGEVNGYGRTVPFGGTVELPSGEWAPLPNAPEELTGGWSVDAVDGPRIASGGYLYDDVTERWTRLPQPVGGPDRPGAAVWAGDRLVVLGDRKSVV